VSIAILVGMSDVTRILSQIELGDPQAAEKLLPLVYDELRKLAAVKLAQEKPGQTLQATALVHEAYVRLVGPDSADEWDSRGHFFAAAAEAMRRILVDLARRKQRPKHGGDRRRMDLDFVFPASDASPDTILAMDEALTKLALEAPDKARLIQLRFYGGCTLEEAAKVMGISFATAKRYWTYARAWLFS
jgi:RNA polymerase sigma factor (TIGR02999 family)